MSPKEKFTLRETAEMLKAAPRTPDDSAVKTTFLANGYEPGMFASLKSILKKSEEAHAMTEQIKTPDGKKLELRYFIGQGKNERGEPTQWQRIDVMDEKGKIIRKDVTMIDPETGDAIESRQTSPDGKLIRVIRKDPEGDGYLHETDFEAPGCPKHVENIYPKDASITSVETRSYVKDRNFTDDPKMGKYRIHEEEIKRTRSGSEFVTEFVYDKQGRVAKKRHAIPKSDDTKFPSSAAETNIFYENGGTREETTVWEYKKPLSKEILLGLKPAADHVENVTRIIDEHGLLTYLKDESRENTYAYDHDGRLQQIMRKNIEVKSKKPISSARLEYKYTKGSTDASPDGLIIVDDATNTKATYVRLPEGERGNVLAGDYRDYESLTAGGWYKRIQTEQL